MRPCKYTSIVLVILAIGAVSCLTSCSGNKSKGADTIVPESHDLHADNDIVMSIRSIIDTIELDQPLDSAEYNYQGILTDGSGMPLYTDIQGTPGQWTIEVLSPDQARIKNLYLGDLVPEELSQYILTGLDIPDSLKVKEGSPVNFPDAEIAVYDFGKGQLILETLTAHTESGHSGPLVNILIRKKPVTDEKHSAV